MRTADVGKGGFSLFEVLVAATVLAVAILGVLGVMGPILNDDGDGQYEGPTEGQGNVFFGDPRFGTGGVTDGYLYAQNNAYLVNSSLDGSYTSDELVWGVQGFLNAGNQLLFGQRSAGSDFDDYRVKYDDRFQRLAFKGIPRAQGGGFRGLEVVAWQEIGATD